MPCQSPGFIPISEDCCFNCFSVGRLPYSGPLAIVLHEYDGHIEQLNNELERCCQQVQDCHASFHYGVGDQGHVFNWVDPENTAWSFAASTQFAECGICNWTFGSQQGSQDPNLYTINIAVATGISSIVSGKHHSGDVYSMAQYDALVQLVGWLAETYSISVNQNTIWRHCDELDDFPSACPNENTFSDFLQDVQACIDSDVPNLALCAVFCDAPVQSGPPGYLFGADDNCENCGRYEIDLCAMFSSMSAGIFETMYFMGVDEAGQCVYMPVTPTCESTELISSAFGVNSNGVPGFYPIRQTMTHRDGDAIDALIPSTDRIVNLDAETENVVFDLVEPGPCDPADFWIKRMDCNSENTVAVNGVIGDIDGDPTIFLRTPGPIGRRGEAIHIYWNGVEWEII